MAAHAFTPGAAASVGGPQWLTARRVVAAEQLAGMAPPTSDEEIWRYSRIDAFDPADWAPLPGRGAGAVGAGVPVAVRSVIEEMVERSGLLVTVNGRVVHREL
ncbi:MAG: hypothetical protein ACT4PI_14185, partial [Actinomycetota bacterium]